MYVDSGEGATRKVNKEGRQEANRRPQALVRAAYGQRRSTTLTDAATAT